MPVMNGFESIQKISAEAPAFNRNIPVIALTAAALEEERRKMFLAGANDFITKPFSPQQLNKRIEDIIITMREKNKEDIFVEEFDKEDISSNSLQFDLAYLMEFTGGDTFFTKEMISMFLEYNPKNLKDLTEAYRKEDWASMQFIAHQMKANLGMLGLQVLEENAKDIEQSVKKGILSIDYYKEVMESLINNLPIIYEELKKTLEDL
jgi:CheY-like chemotaxis protein